MTSTRNKHEYEGTEYEPCENCGALTPVDDLEEDDFMVRVCPTCYAMEIEHYGG